MKNIPDGVYPTMVTPFTDDNKIDYDGVLKILEWYNNKVDGVFAICQSSEIFYLSFEERLELLKFIIKNKPADMSIVASGHTADDLDRQIYEANAFINEGIDAYVFIANRFAKQDEDDSVFLRNYEKMVSSIPEIGLGIYECPYPYKRMMAPETLRQCALDGRLKFLKDTCCQIDVIRAKLKAVEGLGLKIYNANSATLLESLKAGCAGFSGVMGNFHPELYSWLCKNYKTEPEKAEQVQAFLAFASLAECQMYPINAKYHLGLCGVDIGYNCRVKDASLFVEGRQKEINQMFIVEKLFKEMLNL
ncbi:MAG: dihydrodipicolinate synthase family protein [Clostridia bacterium]|nr:dihydrodipicolinate synthase family protein [Clostridia bacterium]